MRTTTGFTPRGLSYAVRGEGPPLLWLSGYVVPVAAFDKVGDALTDRFTVVSVDHRGSGRSRTRSLPTTTGTMAGDSASVLDHLGLDSAHVIGASLGGMVAQELALSRPHRVRSLVLCSTTAGGVGAKSPPLADLVGELRRTGARVPGGQAHIRLTGVLHQAAAAASHDATMRLHRVQAPTLVLHGDQDDLVPLANALWLARRIPSATLQVVAGGSHLLLLESASARGKLAAWLEEHRELEPAPAPSAVARLQLHAETPYRALLGQSLPLRRALSAGSRLARRPLPQPDGGMR